MTESSNKVNVNAWLEIAKGTYRLLERAKLAEAERDEIAEQLLLLERHDAETIKVLEAKIPQGSFCAECGTIGSRVDEDGLCLSCGGDAMLYGWAWADLVYYMMLCAAKERDQLEAELAEANEWIKDFGLENNKLVKERDRLQEELAEAKRENDLLTRKARIQHACHGGMEMKICGIYNSHIIECQECGGLIVDENQVSECESSDPMAHKAGGEQVQPDGTRGGCPNEDPEV